MSFQHEGVVIAHMLRGIAPETPILFIDTGYHFPETLAYRDELVARFGFPIRNLTSVMPRAEFIATYGDDLYNRDPDLCCKINKVEPMQLALRGVRAWINGRRRDQAVTRTRMPIAERLQGGIVKVNPLANWTSRDTYRYLTEHDIPDPPAVRAGLHQHRLRALHAARPAPARTSAPGAGRGRTRPSAGCTPSSAAPTRTATSGAAAPSARTRRRADARGPERAGPGDKPEAPAERAPRAARS